MALVFLAAALAHWVIRDDGAVAALWLLPAFVAAVLAVGQWLERHTETTVDRSQDERTAPDAQE